MTAAAIVDWLQRIVAFGFAFGLLVFVHEFGHFLVARLCGVTVEVFSFGFGKRLFGIKRKGTDYRVSIIPLGGYVKMLGEIPEDDLTGDPGEFQEKPRWQRTLVLLAGPVMNVILATGCYVVVFRQGDYRAIYLDEPPIVGGVDIGLPAKAAGIKPGDLILAVDGTPVANWDEFQPLEMLHPDNPVSLTLRRFGKTIEVVVKATSQIESITHSKLGVLGIEPRGRVVVSAVTTGRPAAVAGLDAHDIIVSIGGEKIGNLVAPTRIIRASKGAPLDFEIERNGERKTLTIAAQKDESGIYRAGFYPVYEARHIPYTWLQAVPRAVKEVLHQTGFTYFTLKSLLTRKISMKQMSGPIGIFQFTGQAAKTGLVSFITVIGLISLQLGIINLLPIPMLDGGHIFIIIVETIMRRDLPVRLKDGVSYAGFVFLILLMAVVIFNDISKNIPGGLEHYLPWGGP